jgi:hypothetical protein
LRSALCGVVWCGVVWCGVVWCGVVWCGVVWCGVVWCGVVWCGVVCLACCWVQPHCIIQVLGGRSKGQEQSSCSKGTGGLSYTVCVGLHGVCQACICFGCSLTASSSSWGLKHRARCSVKV